MAQQCGIIPESQDWFRSKDHCHICGERFERYDEWCCVEADELFTQEEGRVNRKVKAQWHVYCEGVGENH